MDETLPECERRTAVILDETARANVVHVFGDLDRACVYLLDDAVARAGHDRPLVVDFTHCRYLDSSVLSALVRVHARGTQALHVVLPEDHPMRRIFTITNLDAVLTLVPTFDAAQRSIRAARPRLLRAV